MAPTSPLTAVLPGFEPTIAALGTPRQQSLADLGAPLVETTFVVLDLETTGGSAAVDAITEIGALKLRGGELLGRFESLVNPGVPIPPMITVLTGITESMVLPAPRIAEVLPALLEFAGDAVIVGHNIRFDCAFLDAALVAHGYPRLSNRRVDTLALARRLVRDEIPNLRLHTLASHFRTSVEPNHRAYADAAATAEVLHALLERAASYGVLGLDDLLALPSMRAHPSAAKLALTARLPRAPGVYVFRDRDGRVLYVGKATNLRARVPFVFRVRRPAQGAAAVAGARVDRPSRLRDRVRSRDPRAAPHPATAAALQPPGQVDARAGATSSSPTSAFPASPSRAHPRATARGSGRSSRRTQRTSCARRSSRRCRCGGARRGSAGARRSSAGRRASRRSSASPRARAGATSTRRPTANSSRRSAGP